MMKPKGDGVIVLACDGYHFNAQKALQKSPKWSKFMENVDELISPYHKSKDPVAQVKSYLDGLFNSDYIEHHSNTRTYEYSEFKGKFFDLIASFAC